MVNVLANLIQINSLNHKSPSNALNSNQIERFYNYNKQSPKKQFCPLVCAPVTLEGRIFLSLLCPSGISGDKNAHFQGIKHSNTKIYKEIIDEI